MLPGYKKTSLGVIKQIDVKQKQKYDFDYIAKRYDVYKTTRAMSSIRYDIIHNLKLKNKSILDVGYGNGDFLKICNALGYTTFGHDISGYPISSGSIFSETIDLPVGCATFFDSLEHFEDINVLENLRAEVVVISVPWCHYPSDEWFYNWKHRRPDEHLWHFDQVSLCKFMESLSYNLINLGNPEDEIRKPLGCLPNILTAVFRRKN